MKWAMMLHDIDEKCMYCFSVKLTEINDMTKY